MSHYHLEVVLPPQTRNVEAALAHAMAPFLEGGVDGDGDPNSNTFYDYYVIGGRFSGAHIEAGLDPDKLKRFYEMLSELKITISGVRMGKPTLQPVSQREVVDGLWRKAFPESGLEICPLFDHFPMARYDICTLKLVPAAMDCAHFMVVGPPEYPFDGKAAFMLLHEMWNGVTWQTAAWDGTFGAAVGLHRSPLPPDSIVVTVDYHS